MRDESDERREPLRTGLTTGACATACTVAAASYLFSGNLCKKARIALPRGQIIDFDITDSQILSQDHKGFALSAQATTIKNAGDDPDVTHGALITVMVKKIAAGVKFVAGKGVGTITKAGLSLAVGEPAINPVPRSMMVRHLDIIAEKYKYTGGFQVTVTIANGEDLAKNTMNARLGILGGLSVLGTTGIVKPFSCSAYIASIHQGIDVAQANGLQHIAACTGRTSEAAVQKFYQLPAMGIIEMGDYVGAVTKYLTKSAILKLTLAAGFGKLCKLAAGNLNLHSSSSAIDFNQLAEIAFHLGAQPINCQQIKLANTSWEVLQICMLHDIPIVQHIREQAIQFLHSKLPETIELDIVIVDRLGNVL